jgi:hypothetical protein
MRDHRCSVIARDDRPNRRHACRFVERAVSLATPADSRESHQLQGGPSEASWLRRYDLTRSAAPAGGMHESCM